MKKPNAKHSLQNLEPFKNQLLKVREIETILKYSRKFRALNWQKNSMQIAKTFNQRQYSIFRQSFDVIFDREFSQK